MVFGCEGVESLVHQGNFRRLVVKREFQEFERCSASHSEGERYQSYRVSPEWLPSTMTSLNPVISKISRIGVEGRVTSRTLPPFFIWR